MRKLIAVLAVGALSLAPSLARADVALGTHFGAGVAFPKRDSATFFVSVPFAASDWIMPGFRATFAGESGRHEIYLDTTFVHRGAHDVEDANGNRVGRIPSAQRFLLFIAYQHLFDPRQSNSFFFNAGGGPVYWAGDVDDSLSFMMGGGVGFRQRIAGGHGTFREELRLDFIVEHKGIPQAAILGFKFGFDLWFR